MSTNEKSSHIFNTSASLFGLCFVVFTSFKALKVSDQTYIDEFTAGAMFLFILSCSASFLAIRSSTKRSTVYESMADYIFMGGMFILFITTVLVVFKVMS